MEDSYWTRVVSGQGVSRRKVLTVASTGLGAAAILAACGGSGGGASPDSGTSATSSKASSAAPAAKRGDYTPGDGPPRPGGRYVLQGGLVANFNPISNWSEGTAYGGAHVYDRPITSREDERRYVLEAMASAETPEPTKLIMKLKPGQSFHDFPPVNGRALKGQDVVDSQT